MASVPDDRAGPLTPVTPTRIAVVEDDPRVARSLTALLQREGFAVHSAGNGAAFRQLLRRHGADIVLMDLTLGAEDGLHLAREIARNSDMGLIIVTSRDTPQERVLGLDAGADDYISKPFAPEELVARVRAVLRRRSSGEQPGDCNPSFGPVQLDIANHLVICSQSQKRVQLTDTEAHILEILMREQGRPASRATLLAREVVSSEDRSVDVHVANIRRKLRAAGLEGIRLYPVRGVGYRLALEVETPD